MRGQDWLFFCPPVQETSTMAELVGVFGGTGAFLLAVGGYLCKKWAAYDTSFFRGVPISNQPTVTLPSTWEDGIASDEEDKHYHRMKYATKDGHSWRVSIQDQGGVFLYKDYYSKAGDQRRPRLAAPSPERGPAGRETLVRAKALERWSMSSKSPSTSQTLESP